MPNYVVEHISVAYYSDGDILFYNMHYVGRLSGIRFSCGREFIAMVIRLETRAYNYSNEASTRAHARAYAHLPSYPAQFVRLSASKLVYPLICSEVMK